MRTVKIGTHTVEMYDAIDELPMARFHKYQKYLLIDSGIGSTIEDFDRRIEKARRFCMQNDAANAQKELENMRQCVYMIENGLSPKHLSFACLVSTIDGKQCNDLSDDALQKVVETFAEVPQGELTDHLDSVKKKIDTELTLYFPRVFEDSTVKEYYDIIRKRTILILRNIVAGLPCPDGAQDVQQLTNELMTSSKPQRFTGVENAEIMFDRQYENLCVLLSDKLNVNPKNYTVLEFYNAIEFLKERNRLESQAHKMNVRNK